MQLIKKIVNTRIYKLQIILINFYSLSTDSLKVGRLVGQDYFGNRYYENDQLYFLGINFQMLI